MKKNNNKIFGGDYIDELDKRLLSNRVLWFLVFVISGVLFLISMAYFSLASNVKVSLSVPPYKQNIEIRHNSADAPFFDLWGTYYASCLKDFDKTNIKDQLAIIISKMMPGVYLKSKEKLEKLYKNTYSNNLVFHFNTEKKSLLISSDGKRAKYELSGIANSVISGQTQPTKRCKISLNLNFIDGDVYVSNIETNCI